MGKFKTTAPDGAKNICRHRISLEMQRRNLSQNDLAKLLQLHHMDIDKNAISHILNGSRNVNDVEVKIIAKCFNITSDELLNY